MCIASDEVYSNAGNFLLVSSEAVEHISKYPSHFLYLPAVRIFGEAYNEAFPQHSVHLD